MKRFFVCLAAMLAMLALFSCCALADTTCPKCGSKWYQNEYRKPTCGRSGVLSGFCPKCNKIVTKKLAASSHSYGEWIVTKQATCTETGSRYRKCKNCGATDSETISRTGHSFGEWKLIQEAGDFSCGVRRSSCTVCGEEVEETYYPEGTLQKGDRGKAVKILQKALNAKGYACGSADGDFGSKTENAVLALQRDNSLPQDGIAYPGVMALLGMTLIDGVPCALEAEIAECPKKAEGFVGSSVAVSVRVRNTGAVPLTLTDGTQVESGAEVTVPISYEIAEEDASLGELRREIALEGTAADGTTVSSDKLEISIPLEKVSVKIEAQVVSAPANGSYYQMGETIAIDTVVTNEGDVPLSFDGEKDALQSGESLKSQFTHVVTQEDVSLGTFSYAAQATFEGGSAAAEAIVLRTREPVALTLEKSVSTPKNGSYFLEGEIATYTLVLTNVSQETIEGITLIDMLLQENSVIAENITLAAGETFSVTFDYTVEKVDAVVGFITNRADAVYGETTVASNVVLAMAGTK